MSQNYLVLSHSASTLLEECVVVVGEHVERPEPSMATAGSPSPSEPIEYDLVATAAAGGPMPQSPPARRHVTFSPSVGGEETENDGSDASKEAGDVDVAVAATKTGNERPVDLFENWSEWFGESTFLPFAGKSSTW